MKKVCHFRDTLALFLAFLVFFRLFVGFRIGLHIDRRCRLSLRFVDTFQHHIEDQGTEGLDLSCAS